MNLKNKLFRCSSLHLLIGQPKSKSEVLSQTAKNAIRDMVKIDTYGAAGFSGNKYTKKGLLLEDQAIKLIGDLKFRKFEKNTLRVNTDLLTGEADIVDVCDKLIIDAKCTWDINTHPFFKDEAMEKIKKAGYDVQINGYMSIFSKELGLDFNSGEISFCLFPNEIDQFSSQYDIDMSEAISNIPLDKRVTTIKIDRDESLIKRIEEVIPHAQRYYKQLQLELLGYE